MKLLFVNACPRGEQSRTLRLCRTFLQAFHETAPGAEIIEQDLNELNLLPVNAQRLAAKEALCDAYDWQHPTMAHALAFQQADAVVIGAPYWDMSFPSILKIWVENMYVRNLTFRYMDDKSVGLCRGQKCVYLATAGSPIGENDWGAGYIRAVMQVLGVKAFESISAEALDLAGYDPEAILQEAEEKARQSARALARMFQEQ